MKNRNSVWRLLWRGTAVLLLAGSLISAATVLWLFLDSHRDRNDWFDQRQGQIANVERNRHSSDSAYVDEHIRLTSSSGLSINVRVARPTAQTEKLPLLLLLGGQRTGSDAVSLFNDIGERAIVAFDYPYDGPQRPGDAAELFQALSAVRRASLDIAPAISLALDWLLEQQWVDPDRVTMIGVSLGVPFATTAAARDERIKALLLIHGAADNRRWMDHNLRRRIDGGPLQPLLVSISNWIIQGPLHDTRQQIAELSPRPVMIVGARDDERIPAGETEALFAAAREPKSLDWTEGRHITTRRHDILNDLMELADKLLSVRDADD